MPGDPLKLVGLDFGTTTSSAVIATARVLKSAVTGRSELAEILDCFRSEPVFTPFHDDGRIDEQQIERFLDEWLASGDVSADQVFGGGAILTGLTAQAENAAALVRLIRARLQDALIATAGDSCFESWLAFMGSCAPLSRRHPTTPILNLDIGGGTTNLALGLNGRVSSTGCLFVGARHVQVVPGEYRLVKFSPYAQAAFKRLDISKGPGDLLNEREITAFVNFQIELLEAAVAGNDSFFADPLMALHRQVPLASPFAPAKVRPFAEQKATEPTLTFSGGVGELIYAHVAGRPWPGTTAYGDLGIDLARRIMESPRLSRNLRDFQPESAGRATVYGLLRHSTEVSGTSLFLSRPTLLPLSDLPILGLLTSATPDDQMRRTFELAGHTSRGGCVQVELGSSDAATVRAAGQKIAHALREIGFPPDRALVLLVRENVGKVLGSYVTEWGALPLSLAVIDEVTLRDAQFIQIGAPRQEVVPVSYYGFPSDFPGERDA